MFPHWRRLLCVFFAASGAAACINVTQLDRIYIASRKHGMELGDENRRAYFEWRAEHERWERGELGPGVAEPKSPPNFDRKERDAARMRFMERELAAFLERSCNEGGVECILRQLTPLGFACNDATPIECWANTVDRYDYYDQYFSRQPEYHAWIVTVAREGVKPAVHVRNIILPRNPN
jgi:hypothetical protein